MNIIGKEIPYYVKLYVGLKILPILKSSKCPLIGPILSILKHYGTFGLTLCRYQP